MDKDGYPRKSELQKIKQWSYNDFFGLMEYVKTLWKYADCGFWREGRKYFYLSTGGWSGNESIIAALRNNNMFWAICWYSSKRGGHYIFEIRSGCSTRERKIGPTIPTCGANSVSAPAPF